MARLEASESTEAEQTRPDGAGPPTLRDPRRLVRGAVLAGKYRLEALLGEGGMAVVWSAYHLELEVPVAIKLLRGGQGSRLEQRLRHEARAAARLAHPAIVRVLDASVTEGGDPFIVMELLTGETLTDLVLRERPNALRIVQLLLPVIDGLAAAHEQGIVHRDIKPDNVFLAIEGGQLQPKLVDFGIAKLQGRNVSAPKLTEPGTALGSPSYMSPEQACGQDVDYRTDVWSLCVLLYKVIGGKAPFTGSDTRATLDAILEHEAPPLPLRAGVDPHLARIIHSGLNKDPAARPASMRGLGQRLARWLLLHGVAVDACGTPLISKWLPSDMPPRSVEGDVVEAARKAAESQLSCARVAMPASVPPPPPSSQRKTRRLAIPAKNRRLALWALAGVLVASGCLAWTSSGNSKVANQPSLPPPPPRILAGIAPAPQTVSVAPRPGEVEPPLVAEPEPEPEPTVTAERAKSPPKRRPTLPF